MRRIRSKDTAPEMMVRTTVHRMGFRYRLHAGHLPGRPDLVFGKRKKIIFVHGCFWHMHERCKLTHVPVTRREYWKPKLEGNRRRDEANRQALEKNGWSVLVIWEC